MKIAQQQEQREIAGDVLWEEPEFLDEGPHGVVYQISNNLVAKSGLSITHEFNIMSALYERSISVPKPYGLHTLPKVYDRYNYPTTHPSLVMEYIRGKTGIELFNNYSERNLAFDLTDVEIKKAEELGFKPRDAQHLGNLIFTSDKKVVLIDFAEWTHPDIPKPHFN